MLYVGTFATLILLLQQVDRTSLFFSVCSFLFIVIAGLAFNLAGGLSTPSGGYVFFYSVLTVIVGLVTKIALGEPGQSNLLEAHTTILVFLGGICGMLIAVMLSRRLSRKRALLADLSSLSNLQSASTGCLVFSIILYLLGFYVQHSNGSLFSALTQLNRFSEMAILLGVTYQIRKSGGRSSVNFPALAATALVWINGGLLSFSKQQMFTPLVCWALAAGAQNYRITRAQALGGLLVLAFMFRFMVPYAQYGRSMITGTYAGNVAVSIKLLSDLGSVREHYLSNERASIEETKSGYYDTPQGFFDRLQMLYPDSTLIESTEKLFPSLARRGMENVERCRTWARMGCGKSGHFREPHARQS